MMHTEAAAPSCAPCTDDVRAAIVSAALVTRDTGMPAAVVLPRQPEAVARARYLAERIGVAVWADVAADGIEIHFGPSDGGAPARRATIDTRPTPALTTPVGTRHAPTAPLRRGERFVAALLRLARCMAGRSATLVHPPAS